jgi:hypothetical protein
MALPTQNDDNLNSEVDQVLRLLIAFQDTPLTDEERNRRFTYNILYLISSLIILATSVYLFLNNDILAGSIFFLLGAASFWMCGRQGLGGRSAAFGIESIRKVYSKLMDQAIRDKEKAQ